MIGLSQLRAHLADRYDVEREIGQGGMATVYLAHDVKHHRRVAVKVLNPELGAVLGVERFLAEIETTANLQHPNLLPLFDSGAAGTTPYYVMPFIDGESLRARLDREKQLPIDETVRMIAAIGAALDYAHRHGVIHRDLKPENILLHDGQPIVADFGIALAVSNAGGNRITATGLSLGTPSYMSPEQATGDRVIDARADVYSLGAVAYEMLAGEPPHVGSSSQAVIARLLTERPRPLRALRATVPAHVEAAIARALEKLPSDRWMTARDFADGLSGLRPVEPIAHVEPTGGASRGTAIRARWRQVALAAIAFGSVAASVLYARRASAPGSVGPDTQFELALPDSLTGSMVGAMNLVALSEDGATLVFQGARGSQSAMLYLRRMHDPVIVPIAGTELGVHPAISPNGRELAFVPATTGTIKRVTLGGGTPRLVVSGAGAGTWVNDTTILYSSNGILFTVSADGGTPRLIAAPDSARGHRGYTSPKMLPGGTAALLRIFRGLTVNDSSVIGAVSLADGRVTELGIRGIAPAYLGSGHLLYGTPDGTLLARQFDVRTLRVTGESVRLAEGLGVGQGGAMPYAAAPAGNVVAYLTGSPRATPWPLVMVNRRGVERPIDVPPGFYQYPRLSPDQASLVMTIPASLFINQNLGSFPDIWQLALGSKVLSRVTTDSSSRRAVWSADGASIGYVRAGAVIRHPMNGTGSPTFMVRGPADIVQVSLGSPGGVMALEVSPTAASADIYISPMDSVDKPRPLLTQSYDERDPQLSRDGTLLAYVSNRTGREEVYIRSVHDQGAEIPVSTGGGTEPRWGANARELFYRSPTHLMSATIARPQTAVLRRDTLFLDRYRRAITANYDVFADGQRFVMVPVVVQAKEARSIVVRTNVDLARAAGRRGQR